MASRKNHQREEHKILFDIAPVLLRPYFFCWLKCASCLVEAPSANFRHFITLQVPWLLTSLVPFFSHAAQVSTWLDTFFFAPLLHRVGGNVMHLLFLTFPATLATCHGERVEPSRARMVHSGEMKVRDGCVLFVFSRLIAVLRRAASGRNLAPLWASDWPPGAHARMRGASNHIQHVLHKKCQTEGATFSLRQNTRQ